MLYLFRFGLCRATGGGFPSPLDRTRAYASGAHVPLRGTRDYRCRNTEAKQTKSEQVIAHLFAATHHLGNLPVNRAHLAVDAGLRVT